MAAPTEKLPSELVGEILCRLPTKSVARSRAVCKSWKIFGYGICFDATRQLCPKVAIYECKSDAWKFINAPCEKGWRIPELDSIVCLTGNLYWVAYDSKTCEYFIRSFEFSKEMFKTFCLLPCNEDLGYTQVLAAFRGDRLSVLRQSYLTRKIDILVTKQKIDGNGEDVAWISFMTVSIPNLPRLQHKLLCSQPSYFIDNMDDKRLFVCTCDETGHACIYIVKRDMYKKVRIDAVVDLWPCHLTYTPTPFVEREEHGLEKLPPELVGEILSRLPLKSLARSRAICKPWNAIWEDKSFLKIYLASARPHFIIRTDSQICSVDIDFPTMEVRRITSDIPCTSLVHCDGFLLAGMWKKGFAVWNPWLGQKRWIGNQKFRFCGVGYNNRRPQTGYKVFGVDFCLDSTTGNKLYTKVAIYECKSHVWKFNNAPCEQGWPVPKLDTIVSLNGNLYWISYHSATREYFIRSFDFSKEIFKTFCLVPANEEGEDFGYTQVLAVFKGDRLSVLRQSYLTRKIEILVTREKIDGNGEAVVWINFIMVSIPNLPRLKHNCLDSQPSYFVKDDKRLFVCTCDETGHSCIYIVKGDVFEKVRIDAVVDLWPSHLTCIPSFVPIPFGQEGSQV